ncbi:phosphate transport system permease protein [Clostridium tetani]|uniref:Phosphate transport system permease protein n=1 Tax=Clostridium tetani TaxID=1513 RepID=A0ABC8EBX3_CLOTA|nr:phosphate ABC transporter permease subunit PstC [Clostridium tetani]BDR66767.1 phosphate transport system permease protein [Clostridium tetani]BDR72256.1 phosphate transport system permease protein [Clostridium tetani]BDR80727.1 phosphate transport system permease protein [Clostridium tetani]BDR89182.1 phosphate transport system permease protein [Clostridium tetani]
MEESLTKKKLNINKRNILKKFINEYIGRIFSTLCGIFIVILTFLIICFIFLKGINIFLKDGYSLKEFIFSSSWNPDGENPTFGSKIFILGSILVSLGALLISTPISIALAVFMNHISPKLGQKFLQPALQLFVGIPSVVYGWIGIVLFVPIIKRSFGGLGFSLLAGMIVLSIMILPTIVNISSDAIKSIPKDYVEASLALGATRWQTIIKVVLPSAKSGILTSIVLGLARAFGEALAVQMVIGNTIKLPRGVLDPTATLTSILTMDMANTVSGTPWNDALWALASILLFISFMFIITIRFIAGRGR